MSVPPVSGPGGRRRRAQASGLGLYAIVVRTINEHVLLIAGVLLIAVALGTVKIPGYIETTLDTQTPITIRYGLAMIGTMCVFADIALALYRADVWRRGLGVAFLLLPVATMAVFGYSGRLDRREDPTIALRAELARMAGAVHKARAIRPSIIGNFKNVCDRTPGACGDYWSRAAGADEKLNGYLEEALGPK